MFSGRLKLLNLLAWVLALAVVVIGVVMYVVTDRGVFLVFVALGVLTGLNVFVYDRLVLKPRLRAEAAKAAAEGSEAP